MLQKAKETTLTSAFFNRLLATFFLKKAGGNPEAYPIRNRADAARDEREWGVAAELYREYLKAAPRDFGIWIQLGHMLKENGNLDEALAIYRRAARLRRNDPDLLLSLGHVHKLRGDLTAAARMYGRSMAVDLNRSARSELSSPQLAQHLNARERALLQRGVSDVLARISKDSEGLKPIAANDIELDGDDYIFLSEDPWVMFEVGPHDPGVGGVGELKLFGSTEPLVEDGQICHPQMERVYFNFGEGWAEDRTLTLKAGDVAADEAASPARSLLIAGLKKGDQVRWDPDDKPGRAKHIGITYTPMHDEAEIRSRIAAAANREVDLQIGAETLDQLVSKGITSFESELAATKALVPSHFEMGGDYAYWLARYMTLDAGDYRKIGEMTDALAWKPTFSFVMPTYNTPIGLLRECIDSMLAQTYPHFEICIADDNSTDPTVFVTLQEYAVADERIKIVKRRQNGHISAASNSALELATNEFIVLVDHDDLIPDYALAVVAHYLNRNPEAKILYSDEDKVRENGQRFEPYFKGEFNLYLMFGHNMISHLGVYERKLVETIGGFRLGLEGSQDYDLFFRAYERIRPNQLVHIPHILYHWRAIAGSTAVSADQKGYAIERAKDAINGYFERAGTPLRSLPGFAPGCTGVGSTRIYDIKISIIIPTRNGLDVLRACIESIDASKQHDFELLIVDNGSDDLEALAYLEELDARSDCRVLRDPRPFNFSELNNEAAAVATGEILCFLNNDTEVIEKKWLDRARSLLALPDIGIVGARLLFEDGMLQHFGIGLGMAAHRIAGTLHSGFDGRAPGYFGKARLMQEFSAVTAACMFIRKADFEAAGRFDPELRVAYNDIDLCLRVRKLGLKIIGDPDILLLHKESRTRGSDKKGDRAARLQLEADEMRNRWAEILDGDPYLSPNLAIDRTDFSLAYPPRAELPWRQPASQMPA
jgi:glycosyltransferase involved in cell wall biosynthesis